MDHKQNTWHLLRQWIPVIVAGALGLAILGGRFLQGDYLTGILIVTVVGIVLAWTWYNAFAQVAKMLQAPLPQPLLAYFENRLGQAPLADRTTNLAFSKALVYTLYGRFDSARSEIGRVNWQGKPPMVQAQKTILEAWWAYLEQHDFERGLLLAQQARKLTDVSTAFPGAGFSLSAYDAAIEVGQLLTNQADPTTVASLETKVRRFPALMKVLVAWGLETYYRQSGQYPPTHIGVGKCFQKPPQGQRRQQRRHDPRI